MQKTRPLGQFQEKFLHFFVTNKAALAILIIFLILPVLEHHFHILLVFD